jgi:nucleotide-binding universal stress UspA family protein
VTLGDADRFELGTDGPTSILVGVDGSQTSMRAGAYAAGLARRQGAKLIVAYVGSASASGIVLDAMAGGAVLTDDMAADPVVVELRREVEMAVRERGIDVTFIATRGDPYTELRRLATEMRADAVVVGASTKAGHRLVGSLALRLVKAGRWPVTVVP